MTLRLLRRVLLATETTGFLSPSTTDEDNIEEDAEDEAFITILLLVPFCLFVGNMTRYLHNELYIPVPYTVMLLCIGFALGIGEYQTDVTS